MAWSSTLLIKFDHVGYRRQMPWLQVADEPVPDLAPRWHCGVAGIDAKQPHPSENEGEYGGMEFNARSIADAGDHSVLLHCAKQPCQRFAPETVNSSSP
jgi:hypothetical protein